MARLCDLSCKACRGDMPVLRGEGLGEYTGQVPEWTVVDEHHLSRAFKFPDFVTALEFVNRVGALAEGEGHHPRIVLTWGKVTIDVWTHKVDGLTESDFILAAKIDQL
jgi:4a-hydroxytetrahydrobiopterin dehydratase